MQNIIYEYILNAAGLGYWEVEIPSFIINHNLKHDQIFGYSNTISDWSYEKFLTIVLLDDLEKVKTSFDALNNDGKEYNIEFRIVRPDGEIRWIWAFGVQFKDNAGNVTALMGLVKDITEEHVTSLQLEKNQAITKQFLEHIKLAFYQMSYDCSKIGFLNNEIEVISGKPLEHFLSLTQWLDLVVAEDKARVKEYYLSQAKTNNRHESLEYKIEGKDGSIRNILDRCFVANDITKRVVGILGIIEDLSDINFKRRIDAIFNDVSSILRKNNSLQDAVGSMLKKICSSMEWPIGEVWLLDATKKFLYRFAAYSANTVNDEKADEAITTVPANSGIFAAIFNNFDITYIRDDDQLWHKNYPLCIAARLMHNQEPLGVMNFFVNHENDLLPDVAELLIHVVNDFSMYLQQQFVKEQYFYASNYDATTGLVNRTVMIKSLKDLISTQSNQPIVVIEILVDQIEKINQAFGDNASNKLLKELIEYFLNDPPSGLHLMSNVEGRGFVFLFNNLNNINAINSIVQLMLNVSKKSFIINGNIVAITVSVGVSIFPKDGINEDILLNSAKAAVVKAQKSGGNSVVYATDALRDEVFQQVNIEFALHRALENNEFVLHYQPKVDLKTGDIVGAEALIRWQDPDGTLHFPGYFLDIAESTDLIIPIGEWVLREVCRQIAEDDFGVPIAVNLSIRQFKTNNYFFDFVSSTIEQFDINPKMLEFEVTESIIISGKAIIEDFMKFRNMGIKIAFDDFGTKYCSLSYLKNYVPDRMKIDKSFVDGVPSSETNIAIINAIVTLAKSLNILLTVEGAELPEQVKFFINLGCDDLQSYYISKAVPAEEFKKLLNNNYKSNFDNLML